MLDDGRVQQTIVDYLHGVDVSKAKIALAPLKFKELPTLKTN